ncbi:O-antigen/teichoic acid export membrane protein [Paenibacillus cellulosilyticus]|uniref:O-antigen/teichoic acid export membrane protein n=1 Tax=Paenibacillus cellulosilyticus TaxID=375489 RepID=A0A2V2YPF9_9BACL|nr:polysaccharide biosynthesis protein [Paenibacillus cellulosilyticus]PWV95991.1 O-antigen/teichoic acid export membrane protein [Paenibacillus cellulosilyticus]QKS48454.1 polysaccharide biosynthesis protein [Paenibacillus cellulosilyticus]
MNSVTGQHAHKQVWNGALLMAAAMMVSKLLGVLQKIPLQNLAGDRVFGIYNAVYPLYQLLLVAATAGLPPAVAIVVARRLADGDQAGALHARRAALWLLGASGAVGFALLWFGAPLIASAIGDAKTSGAIRSVAVALWFVPALSALRGYSQGKNELSASALSQVVEQFIRVAVMAALLAWGLSNAWQDPQMAAGAMAGSGAGAVAAMALMAWRQRRERDAVGAVTEGSGQGRKQRRLAVEMKELSKLAFPMAFGAIAVPMAAVVDVFMVPRLLISAGMQDAAAMAQFGMYGRGQTLVQLVAMISGAAASAMVPSLALAHGQRHWQEARSQAGMAMKAAWWIGTGAALGIALLARPINVMLFADDHATGTFALIGFTALAAAVSTVAAAVLQGCGRVKLPALLLLGAAALKAALNAALVPAHGIAGAAAAGAIALTAAAIVAALAARAALAASPARAGAGGTAAPGAAAQSGSALAAACRLGFALACMAAALALTERATHALGAGLPPRAAAALQALTGVAVGACVFAAALLRSGGIGAREWRALPGGERIAARLVKLRLIPKLHR